MMAGPGEPPAGSIPRPRPSLSLPVIACHRESHSKMFPEALLERERFDKRPVEPIIVALDAFQEVMRYVFKLLFHADDDAKGFRSSISSAAKRRHNRHGHPAQHQDAVLNSSMLRKRL